jgi:hypothetical protein
MSKYKLKEGIVLRPFGTGTITNENLTDDVAEWLLENGKATQDQFEGIEKESKKTTLKNK